MDEKKIIYKSIDEQLAEDERREAAKVDVSRKSPGKAVEKAVTGTNSSNGPRKGRSKLRLKKSVRRTIGSLMLATSVVVAAVPVGGVSADSGGIYRGSTATAPDLTDIDPDSASVGKTSDLKVDNIAKSNCIGGFPLKQQVDSEGVFVKKLIGDKEYWIVDDSQGYTKDPRPVYAIDKGAHYIDKFLETVGTDDVYITPGGKLNLVNGYIGYVNDTSVTPDKEIGGRLYRTEVIEYSIDGYTLYGKRISIYDQVAVETCRVNFYDIDGNLITYRSVVKGTQMDSSAIPTVPTVTGRTGGHWSPDVSDSFVITDDPTEVHAVYDPLPTSTASPQLEIEPAPLPESDTTENTEVDTTETTVDETTVPPSPTETLSPIENASPTEAPTPIPENNDASEPTEVIEEEHEIEESGAGYKMNGVFLIYYPSETDPDRREYKDDPTEVYYVCDDYASITNICNEAFKDTTQVSTVDLPSNIIKIGNSAFYNSFVKTITLGSGLQSIGVRAFEDCRQLDTINYLENMSPFIIGARAFANDERLTTLAMTGESGFIIPPTVTKIGDAAFYGDRMSSIDFKDASGVEIGNFAFARCKSLTSVDMSNDTETLTISNLGSVDRLFAECDALVEATIPNNFNGTLQPGTFGSCTSFNHIIFKDGNGTFSDGEFDNYLVTVEGPAPSNVGNYLDPAGNSSGSYTSAVKPDDPSTPKSDNDYVYRYYTADGKLHEVANEKAYVHSDNFFTDKSASSETEFIFDVDESDFTLSGYFDRNTITPQKDLEIGSNIGKRNEGDIPILKIGNGVFEKNEGIQYLQLDSNIKSIGDSAFKNTKIQRLWANVDGAEFGNNSFADNAVLERATFAYAGEGGSRLDDNSFGNSPALMNVDFYDDNITTGDKNKYARFFPGSIASNAFYTEGRTQEITFKGPMIKDYAPWEFAINPDSKISNKTIYTLYYSGNPWNLTAQYQEQPFTRTYVDYSNSESDTVGDPPANYTKTKSFRITGSDFETGNGGVCLLKYPNMSSYADNDDIDNEDGTGTRTIKSLESETTPTQMMLDCMDRAKNVLVPYGIDFIDTVKTKRTDYTAGEEYYRFIDEPTDPNYYLYRKDGGAYYEMFRYNPDLLSVTFEDGSATDYPDRMFEGATNLDHVVFNNDVHNLGYLPFYMPDTEGYVPSYSEYLPFSYREGSGNNLSEENRSHLSSVVFNAEGDVSSASNANLYYSSSNGIIKGANNSDTILVQICPSKGDPVLKSNPKGEKFFGSSSVLESDLAGITKYSPYAAKDCDMLTTVNFPADGCYISYGCFEDCDKLASVYMPNKFVSVGDKAFAYISNNNMQVTFPYREAQLNKLPFEPAKKTKDDVPYVIFHVNNDAEGLQDYAEKHANIEWVANSDTLTITYLDPKDSTYKQEKKNVESGSYGNNYPPDVAPSYPEGTYTWEGSEGESWNSTKLVKDTIFMAKEVEKVSIIFKDSDGTVIKSFKIPYGSSLSASDYPVLEDLKYWSNDPGVGNPVTEDTSMTAVYKGSTTSTTSTSSSTSTTSSTGGGTTSSTTSRSSSSSSSSRSSSSSSSTALPVFVNSQDAGAAGPVSSAGVNSTVYVGESSGSGSSGSGGSNRGSGNTTVISTAGGITDTGKISATVNGSSDNYVVKITQTQEADEAGLAALHGAYGDDISAIRYLPFDISLYDSTGTNKISPVPAGVSVSITMPIPDDLAIYGGNAKIASTEGGVLDRMTPRFTVINGVPCMTYTCTHFSPYMVWVDTANLTEAGIMDATPKTADGIHPKWFLCFGLAAIAVVMFLKKDPEEYLRKKAA